MPPPHAPFCDLPPERAGHGPYCISRPIARQAVASSEQGQSVEITVDLAVRWADLGAARLVRVISEPQDITARFVSFVPSGVARQLAAALVVAADQAEEVDHELTAPGRGSHADA